jgi:hypothetical protein
MARFGVERRDDSLAVSRSADWRALMPSRSTAPAP